jgi:hypothetical protein
MQQWTAVERVIIAAAVIVVAVVFALVVARRRPAPPTQSRWNVPGQLDRNDFERPDVPWLVAVFSSATCETCAGALAKAGVLASASVVVQEVEVSARPDLHKRYAIDAVPLIAVADDEGVVRAAFVGTPSATDLWAAVAEARQPGVSPEPELGHPRASGEAFPA